MTSPNVSVGSVTARHESTADPEVFILSIKDVRTDGTTQNRTMNWGLVRQYAGLVAETQFPPLRVWFDGVDYWLTDGFHRLAAAEKAGFKYVTVNIHYGTIDDAVWDSFSVNSTHGLHRRQSDLEVIIARAINHTKADQLSNVELARHLGIPETTLRRWRKRLSSPSGDDRCRLVSRNGTNYTLHLKKGARVRPSNTLKQRTKLTLNEELQTMKRAASCEGVLFLDAIDRWIFGNGSPNEFLKALESLLTDNTLR